jgi:SAM-dependent methyltransferase
MKTREYLVEQTKQGYNKMAKDWAGTRMNFWHELTSLVHTEIDQKVRAGIAHPHLLDLGCGNGRFYREVQDTPVVYFGCDVSEGLIQQAHKYHPELSLAACDARNTPYAENTFDVIVSFAVLHHFPGRHAQRDVLSEIERLLTPGGRAVVTVWNIWKTRKGLIWRHYLQYFFSSHPFALGDVVMDFTHHKGTRFVHGFTKRELRRLVKKTGLRLVSLETKHRESKKGSEENFVLILEKNFSTR